MLFISFLVWEKLCVKWGSGRGFGIKYIWNVESRKKEGRERGRNL